MTPPEPDPGLRRRLQETARGVPAPDVVLAWSRQGHRTLVTAGTRPAPTDVPREALRYELGSVTKTFTGLLLAALVHDGVLSYADPLDAHLPPPPQNRPRATGATLLHAATHTAGLPRLPADFYRHALPRRRTNPYAGYGKHAVLAAYRRVRPRHPPGTRWRYSNLGVAVLGHALGHAVQTRYEDLLTRRVLRPLGMSHTVLRPGAPGTDAPGHGADGTSRVPPAHMGGFVAAGGVRATPEDLLRYLEAHLRPAVGDQALAGALRDVRRAVLRRGPRHRATHTLNWFQQPCDGGEIYFHAGATAGQEAFVGFRPDTGTALAALATRRHGRRTTLVPIAHALLCDSGA